MAYYNTCPYCGANNDPGEICNCIQQSDTEKEEKDDNSNNCEIEDQP